MKKMKGIFVGKFLKENKFEKKQGEIMENFVSLILKESIDIHCCNSKYGSKSLPHNPPKEKWEILYEERMEYWDIELHVCSDNKNLMLEKYVKKIRNIIHNCYSLDIHCIIKPFCMINFCEYLSDQILDLGLKLKKVIITPRKDNYIFLWEK